LIHDKIQWGPVRQSCTQNGERTDCLHLTEVNTGSVAFSTALVLISKLIRLYGPDHKVNVKSSRVIKRRTRLLLEELSTS